MLIIRTSYLTFLIMLHYKRSSPSSLPSRKVRPEVVRAHPYMIRTNGRHGRRIGIGWSSRGYCGGTASSRVANLSINPCWGCISCQGDSGGTCISQYLPRPSAPAVHFSLYLSAIAIHNTARQPRYGMQRRSYPVVSLQLVDHGQR